MSISLSAAEYRGNYNRRQASGYTNATEPNKQQ
jgi:hypothetical protein